MAVYIIKDYSNNTRFIELLEPVLDETSLILNVKILGTITVNVILGLPKKPPGLDEGNQDYIIEINSN